MVKRKGKKHRKYLGSRSHGKGNIKTGRGNGSRGGVGKAGLGKHRKTWADVHEPHYYGRSAHGFVNPAKKPKEKIVHLYDLNQKALLGKLEKKGDKYVVKFKGKVLGTGMVTVPLSITADSWSKRTEEKVKAAGGEMTKAEGK